MEQSDDSSTPSPGTGARRYDGSRRQAEARVRRRRVVDAARALFLSEGFGDTSIERIAREAGVSVQTVYAAFGSKPGILGAVVDVAVGGDDEDVLVRDRPELQWVSEERDPVEWLRRLSGWIRLAHVRSADVLHLVDTVSGTDPALADLAERLYRARRDDAEFAVRRGPLRPAAVGLTVAEAADLVGVFAGPSTWVELVGHGRWSHDRYESWLLGVFRREFLPS